MAQKKSGKSSSGPGKGLEAARRKLEEKLILDVVDEALAAGSGTDTHSFENIKGVPPSG